MCVILYCNSTTLNVFISSKACNCCMLQVVSCYLVFALTHLLCRDGMDVEELRADGCLPRCVRQVDPRCWNIKRLVTINITPPPARPSPAQPSRRNGCYKRMGVSDYIKLYSAEQTASTSSQQTADSWTLSGPGEATCCTAGLKT